MQLGESTKTEEKYNFLVLKRTYYTFQLHRTRFYAISMQLAAKMGVAHAIQRNNIMRGTEFGTILDKIGNICNGMSM